MSVLIAIHLNAFSCVNIFIVERFSSFIKQNKPIKSIAKNRTRALSNAGSNTASPRHSKTSNTNRYLDTPVEENLENKNPIPYENTDENLKNDEEINEEKMEKRRTTVVFDAETTIMPLEGNF